jgi:hypothetical protein
MNDLFEPLYHVDGAKFCRLVTSAEKVQPDESLTNTVAAAHVPCTILTIHVYLPKSLIRHSTLESSLSGHITLLYSDKDDQASAS